MKKKILLFVAIISVLVCVFAISVSADSIVPSDSNEYGTLSTIDGVPEPTVLDKNAKTVVVVNETYYTIPTYYLIADNTVFTWSVHANVKSALGLGSDVRSNLVRFQIPEGIVSVNPNAQGGGTAFEGAGSLVEASIPSTLTLLGQYAFNRCSSLETITGLEDYLETRATVLPPLILSGTKWGTNVDLVIREGITSISSNCFNGTKIRSVTLPSTLEALGEYAFANTSITSVKIPASVVTINNHVFANCSSLATIDLSECTEITTIGRYCFEKSALTSFDFTPFAANMTSIGEGLFNECKSLETVTGYELVACAEVVGEKMFYKTAISEIKMPSQVEKIGSYAFGSFNGTVTVVVIPDSVEVIDGRAFENSTITKVVLPSSLTTLKNHVFASCKSLTVVDTSKCTNLSSIGEYCFERAGVTSFDFTPFAASLTNLDRGIFNECNKLASIPGFENASNLTKINNSVFRSCPLTEIKLPANIESIGDQAFYKHKSVQAELRIPNSVKSIDNHAFTRDGSGGQGIKVYLSANLTTISESYTFEDWLISEMYIPAGVTVIPTGFCNRGLSAGAVFFYTGNEDGFTISSTNNSVLTNAEWIDVKDYTGPSAEKNYIVYGYSACDAFYNGIHVEADTVNGSACYLKDCSRCNVGELYIGGDMNSATHSFSYAYAYNNGFTAVGTLTSTCANAGCNYCAEKTPDVAELDPIFKNLMYSKREGTEFGIVMTYEIDNDALAVYKSGASTTVNFGVVAIAEHKYNSEKDLVKADGTTEQTNIILADISDKGAKTVELVIKGTGDQWEAHKTTPFYILGYYIDGNTVNYFQSASKTAVTDLTTIKFESASAEEVA